MRFCRLTLKLYRKSVFKHAALLVFVPHSVCDLTCRGGGTLVKRKLVERKLAKGTQVKKIGNLAKKYEKNGKDMRERE